MPKYSKKKIQKIEASKREDVDYLLGKFSLELINAERKLDSIKYQEEMFGSNPQLNQERQDCILILEWIRNQFDEIKKSLYPLN